MKNILKSTLKTAPILLTIFVLFTRQFLQITLPVAIVLAVFDVLTLVTKQAQVMPVIQNLNYAFWMSLKDLAKPQKSYQNLAELFHR